MLVHVCGTCTTHAAALVPAGVDTFDVSWQDNKVVVKGNFDVQALVEKLNKSGKKTEMWQ